MWANDKEQKKETLTNNIIENSLKNLYKSKIIQVIFEFLIFSGFQVILYFYLSFNFKDVVIYFVFSVSFIYLFGKWFYDIYKLIKIINKMNYYTVVTDTLINIETKTHIRRNAPHYDTHHMIFKEYGSYKIPDENYKWSKQFHMSGQGVFNSSIPEDEFYLVIVNSKIQLAFNKKFFEYVQQ